MKTFFIILAEAGTYIDYVMEGESLLDAIEREWNTAIHLKDTCADILTFDINHDHQPATAQEIYEWLLNKQGYEHMHIYEVEGKLVSRQ